MAAVEGGGLERMMRVYLSKLAPDADIDARSCVVIAIVQNLVRVTLLEKGYDSDQIKDKLTTMSDKGTSNAKSGQ